MRDVDPIGIVMLQKTFDLATKEEIEKIEFCLLMPKNFPAAKLYQFVGKSSARNQLSAYWRRYHTI